MSLPVTMGGDFRDIFRSLKPAATAAALAIAVTPIVGGVVQTVNRGEYYEIIFNPEQEDRLAEWIRSQLNREPGAVRISSGGVALKVIARQYWPWMLGIAALGGAVAWSVKGGRRGR